MKIPLPQEELDEWADALESGEYEQTTHVLHAYEGFCCLGVYFDACVGGEWEAATLDCEYNVNDNGEYTGTWIPAAHGKRVSGYASRDAFLPQKLLPKPVQKALVTLNDGEGLTFKQIAAIVRSGEIPKDVHAFLESKGLWL